MIGHSAAGSVCGFKYRAGMSYSRQVWNEMIGIAGVQEEGKGERQVKR
jgi:hypothetical protein